MKIGLRIDVDTFRGTRDGVPRLLDILARRAIGGTFFFSVGPDNMGRHLFRLLKPSFFVKMMRSQASRLYGWDILLRGTLWPGPMIGEKLAETIRQAALAGHETGFHAWDHHFWQAHADTLTLPRLQEQFRRGVERLTAITGAAPVASAAPAWQCTEAALTVKEQFPFRYNSDCRGTHVFLPVVDGRALRQPQVPVTLPTYDEVVGREGVTDSGYNDFLFSRLRPGELNVLAIHAEVEGIACAPLFEAFLEKAKAAGYALAPLGQLLPPATTLPRGRIIRGALEGREGWLAVQKPGEDD